MECIQVVRKLKEMHIDVYFEKERIHTLPEKSELLLSIYSSVAQAESESISSNQKWSIQKRFLNGTYILPNPAYGYCTNANGLLELDQKQAAVVRFIFDEYLEGNGIWRIAKSLNEQKIPTKTGKAAWLGGAIYIILKNSVYTGDLLLQKTYSEDIVPFVRRKNNGEYRQVLIENDHEPIVTHEEYEAVQRMLLCDYEEARADKCQELLKKASMPKAAVYSGDKGYEELCKRDDIDLVYIAADWLHHFPVAKCALENGKNVAIEVPSAMNLQECWDLINLSESTRKHCFILENCCYDWFEMNTLNMAQHGVFGEVIRAQGAYIHNLSPFWDHYWKNGENDKLGWRLDYNMKHRGDVYATHGLGPVAQALDIHRGDRMETLVAMDTKSVVGKELVEKRTGEECKEFRNGDHTTTMIRTANGKVIEIQHNVMTPQPYNRLYQLTGTKGFANKYPVEGYALDADQLSASGVQPKVDDLNSHGFLPETEMEALVEKYQHPILKKYNSGIDCQYRDYLY